LITHDEARKDNSFTTSQEGNILTIKLSRYNDMLEIPKANLRTTIVKEFLKHISDFKAYESNISGRLNSLKEFSDLTIRFRALRNI
jgi:hypothetical protein